MENLSGRVETTHDPNSRVSLQQELIGLYDRPYYEEVFDIQDTAGNQRISEERKLVLVDLFQKGHQIESENSGKSGQPLSPEEVLVIEHGKLAATRLMIADISAIVYAVRRFDSKIPFDDLLQEGCMAYMKALKKFNPNRGIRVLTYCLNGVLRDVRRYVEQTGDIISVPIVRGWKRNKILRMLDAGHALPEISQEMEIDVKGLEDILATPAVRYSHDDPKIASGEGARYVDPNTDVEKMVQDMLDREDLARRIGALIGGLDNPRDQEIIAMRFGMRDGIEKTLSEIATHFRMSQRGIQYIIERCLLKIKGGLGQEIID